MAFFLFQRCGEILFENPDQNVKCVCMLGKKAFHFSYIKYVDIMWTSCCLLPYRQSLVAYYRGFWLLYRYIERDNTFICGTLADRF